MNDKATSVIADRYEKLKSERSSYVTRAARYSRHTIAYLFTDEDDGSKATEAKTVNFDGTGAKCINSLSNSLAKTMFPPNQAFFRIDVNPAMVADLAKEEVEAFNVKLATLENDCAKENTSDNPPHEQVLVNKQLLVTGNCLVYNGQDGSTHYNLNKYVTQRDVMGSVLELIIKEKKLHDSLPEKVKEALKATNPDCDKDGFPTWDMYTQCRWDGKKKRYLVRQTVNDILVTQAYYTKHKLPYIPLVWELLPGEHYGRGLVEQYEGSFATIYALSRSNVSLALALSKVIWLIKPGSKLSKDVKSLISNPQRNFYSGNKEDLEIHSTNKAMDTQFATAIKEEQKAIVESAFLVKSSIQRNAERVTATEIRYMASELENSFGGIYSSLSKLWQEPVAYKLLERKDLSQLLKNKTISFTISTGVSSISRNDDVNNIMDFIEKLAVTQNIPDDMKMFLDKGLLLKRMAVGTNINVIPNESIVKTNEQVQQEQKAAAEAAQQAAVTENAIANT